MLEIKEAAREDLETCLEIINAGFLTVADEFGLTRENCPTNGAFIGIERLVLDFEKGSWMYMLVLNRQPVGFMELCCLNEQQYTLEKLTVLDEKRHSGFGRILLDYACFRVYHAGGTELLIGIIAENIRLKEWYKSYGFVSTGTKDYEHLPFTVEFMKLDVSRDIV